MTVKRPLKELTARELALADRAPGAKESYAECRPSEEKPFDVRVMELSDGVQAVPGAVTAGTQTTWRYPENKWVFIIYTDTLLVTVAVASRAAPERFALNAR